MSTPQKITFDDNALRRYDTAKSTSSRNSNPEDEKHDWSVTTDEKDSWANRERRRSSVWNGLDTPVIQKTRTNSNSNPNPNNERRGSILSLWTSGKDKDGKHILHHDDHDDVVIVDDGDVVDKQTTSPSLSPRDQRRGSILSMWKTGTDEKGRAIIHHLDDD